MKEYPLRSQEKDYHGAVEHVCECGHKNNQHEVSNQVMMTYPPKYTYLECDICMCPEYKLEKTYKQYLKS